MNRLLRAAIVVLVIGLMFGGARWAYGQAQQVPQFPSQRPDANPTIINGADIGFRVDRDQTQTLGKLTGTWVVRINGQWIAPQESLRGRPLSTR
jgi:hypothetical protein